MVDYFDRFTPNARKVFDLAVDEARRFNHNYLGTEHELLGLVRTDGLAAQVLSNMGIQLPKVRSSVEFIIGRGETYFGGEIGLTPRAKKVIELAVDEARRLNHYDVDDFHLLLGIVREGEGIAAGVLESLGVNLEKVRDNVMRVLEATATGMSNDLFNQVAKRLDEAIATIPPFEAELAEHGVYPFKDMLAEYASRYSPGLTVYLKQAILMDLAKNTFDRRQLLAKAHPMKCPEFRDISQMARGGKPSDHVMYECDRCFGIYFALMLTRSEVAKQELREKLTQCPEPPEEPKPKVSPSTAVYNTPEATMLAP